MGRTSSAPISARSMNVDKVEGLLSGLLSYTSRLLYPKRCRPELKGLLMCFGEKEREGLKRFLCFYGHIKVFTGCYTYFELNGNITYSIAINTGIKCQKSWLHW